MGKSWDNTGIANSVELWSEVLRVLKPGGHLLSFSGTRTYHRMTCAIEDAGFEIRDMIEWVYGSGFPKSLNIGKAVDKSCNKIKELYNFTKWFDNICKEKNITNKQLDEYLGLNSGGSTCSHYRGWNTQQPRYPKETHFKKLKEWLGFDNIWDEKIAEVEREFIGNKPWTSPVNGFLPDGKDKSERKRLIDTKGTSPWEGWGTALKPSHEPIVLARKPLSEKTVAENVLKWGTGGINIDGSRVDTNEKIETGRNGRNTVSWKQTSELNNKPQEYQSTGRFPANLIHDNSEEVKSCFPNESERFFKSILYYPKASKTERNKGCEELDGNKHCTVKPVALMEYLIKMITPKDGVVLDPFLGSGTTAIAAINTDFNFIGIEKEEEYCKICNARIKQAYRDNELKQQELI